ncbi:unnamed protein product, partial [marine sediment metagenome]
MKASTIYFILFIYGMVHLIFFLSIAGTITGKIHSYYPTEDEIVLCEDYNNHKIVGSECIKTVQKNIIANFLYAIHVIITILGLPIIL